MKPGVTICEHLYEAVAVAFNLGQLMLFPIAILLEIDSVYENDSPVLPPRACPASAITLLGLIPRSAPILKLDPSVYVVV